MTNAIITPKPIKQINTKTPKIEEKPEATIDKRVITELTEKQKLQLKTIQEQTAKNTELSKDLTLLSKQLLLEKTKNETLNSRLSEEEKDRLELEQQLNQMLSNSENNEITIENLTEENIDSSPKIEKTIVNSISNEVNKIEENIINNKISKDEKALKPEITERTVSIVEADTEIKNQINITTETTESEQNIDAQEKDKIVEKSETDKIIEAMSDINSNSEKTNPSKVTQSINITDSKNTENDKVKKINRTNNEAKQVTEKLDKEVELAIKDTKIKEPEITVNTLENKEEIKTINTETNKVINDKENDDTKELVEVSPKPVTEEDTKANNEAPKSNSAVDDIIAAMQSSQAQPSNISSVETDQKIDPELEKEINQQLVEQGEQTIKN